MKSIDIVGMFKTVASVAPLGENKFRVRYGRNKVAIITVEAAQQGVEPTEIPRAPIADFVRDLKRNLEEDD